MILKVNEIFLSIQGESTFAGKPCVFIRLSECNLRCSYCDTVYTYKDGKNLELNEIILQIQKYKCKLVEITGGEPLQQSNVVSLMKQLISNDYTVLVETNGSISTHNIPKDVIKSFHLLFPSLELNGLYFENSPLEIEY